MKVLQAMSVAPGASLPRACGSHSDLMGAYRLFDNQAATLEEMLAGHRAATLRRAAGETVVLAIQDSTWLDYGTHRGCAGLGAHTRGHEHGLLVHLSLLVNGEGRILGTLAAPTLLHGRCRRTRRHGGSDRANSANRIAGRGDEVAMRAAGAQPHVTWISVQDRERDLYPLFAQPRPDNGHWWCACTMIGSPAASGRQCAR